MSHPETDRLYRPEVFHVKEDGEVMFNFAFLRREEMYAHACRLEEKLHETRLTLLKAEQKEEDTLAPYFRSGNNVPITKVTIPWPKVGIVTINLSRCTIEKEIPK